MIARWTLWNQFSKMWKFPQNGFRNTNIPMSQSTCGQRCMATHVEPWWQILSEYKESRGLALLPLKAIILGVSSCCECAVEMCTATPHRKTCLCCGVVPTSSYWKEGLLGIRCLSAISSMFLPLEVTLMALVNHTAIRENMNHWNNCSDLHYESFTRESIRPWFIQCSMTPWRSLSARILDVVLKATLYRYVLPLSFMTSDAVDDHMWQKCACLHSQPMEWQ